MLFNSEHIFIDGTFDVVPKPFKQLVTIHGLRSESGFSCGYFLATSKKETIYTSIFQKLKSTAINRNIDFEPKYIHSDYEPSIISSITKVFNKSRNVGCYFHYRQALFRKFAQNGLKEKLNTEKNIRYVYIILQGIPFLPYHKVDVLIY